MNAPYFDIYMYKYEVTENKNIIVYDIYFTS